MSKDIHFVEHVFPFASDDSHIPTPTFPIYPEEDYYFTPASRIPSNPVEPDSNLPPSNLSESTLDHSNFSAPTVTPSFPSEQDVSQPLPLLRRSQRLYLQHYLS